jgi:hypothetical protein
MLMAIGRFLAMVGVLVWRQTDGKYLLLQRSTAEVAHQCMPHELRQLYCQEGFAQ